jgi:superfamily II DNA or RNA helicase
MPDAPGFQGNNDVFVRGMLVRLIGDPNRFGAFQDVVVRAGRSFGRVQFPSGVSTVPLDQLEPVPTASEEPIEFLRSGRFSEPARLRQVLAHIRLTGRLADVIYSMEATNTDFHAHQFKPVLKMLSSPTGSLLIADEVGLGKTIEAGLIWTELRARFDYRRALIVCPKVLCSKWEAELSSKFGLDARLLSAAELLSLLRDRDRWSRGFVAVCSLQGLKPPARWEDEVDPMFGRASAELARLLRDRADEEPVFDMLVVDEAHHLRNPDTQSNLLGRLLRPVAQHNVFLSATPIHLKSRDLFSLLALIDPETFRHQTALDEILDANRPLIEAREAALRGRPANEIRALVSEAAQHRLLAGTQQIATLLDDLGRLPDPIPLAERARLAGRLEGTNLLANTVNRTRRRDVQELRVVRRVNAHRAEMSPLEREAYDAITAEVQQHARRRDIPAGFLLATPQRLLASCLPAAVDHWRRHIADAEAEDEDMPAEADVEAPSVDEIKPLVERLARICASLPPPQELERHDTKFATFLEVMRKFLASDPEEKAVVFSTFRPTLRYLARRLEQAGIHCETIHGGTTGRDAAISRFESNRGLRVLLSSEVGSEGIDLQFCRTVINYDLPWNPMRVEQRIGRVDRLGQAADAVTVINLMHRGTIDDEIYRRLYERLEICERALGGFEAVLGEEIAKLTPELLLGSLTPEQISQRIDQTSQAIENRLKLEEELEGEAAALIAHGDHVLRSIRTAHEMHRWIGPRDLARYLSGALASLYPGSTIRDLDRDDTYELRLTSEARAAYVDWLQVSRLPTGGRIERETGSLVCRLGRPPAGHRRARAVETITQTHPLVRFVASRVAETDAPKLRPAVAARVGWEKVRAAANIPPGRYAVLAMLCRFGGQVEQERIAYAGFALVDGAALPDDDAERLLLIAAEVGTLWTEADALLDSCTLADRCESDLLERLTERFLQEKAARKAEQDDRAAIQLRTLEQRLGAERGRLMTLIDAQRREISGGSSRARRLAGILAANEGKLKRLEERATIRRAEIERGRMQTAQAEQLAVAIIEVAR